MTRAPLDPWDSLADYIDMDLVRRNRDAILRLLRTPIIEPPSFHLSPELFDAWQKGWQKWLEDSDE